MTSYAEWTGVLLSTLFKECGLQDKAKWFVAEGAEEVKGASSMPISKAMDDCIVAYGMNGEPLRPQQGFPLRLDRPRLRGYLQHQVAAPHQSRRPVSAEHERLWASQGGCEAALGYARTQVGHHVPLRLQKLPDRMVRDHRAGLVRRGRRQEWRYPPTAGRRGTTPSSRGLRNPRRTPGSAFSGIGMEASTCLCRAPPTRSGSATDSRANRRILYVAFSAELQPAWDGQHHYAVEDRQGRERDQWARLGSSRFCLLLGVPRLASCVALAQTYGVGNAPTAAELRPDITIRPTGGELPPAMAPPRKAQSSLPIRAASSVTATRA